MLLLPKTPAGYRAFCARFLVSLGWMSVSAALAQVAPTTVQLPTFDQFTVGSTVWVPDGGSATLGGVNSYQSGTSSRGVPMLGRLPGIGRAFNNRAFGSHVNTSQARVKATIIDLHETDARLRNTEAAKRVRERMGPQMGLAGHQTLDGGGLHVGARVPDATTRRALYLSQNMGGAHVGDARIGKARKLMPDPMTVGGKSSSISRTRKSLPVEPPLILRGKAGLSKAIIGY